MGSTSFLKTKPGFRKSGSSAGSDKEMNGKLKRSKIRRPVKMNDYGMKRIPDYTELAYKEAVSKLRYFLSGNNAPSVRSYGGSASIKNLDESDGDLDKKYSTSFNPLSEYKPRPKLTAKYATLYADSLNNYTPQPTNTEPPPPAADLTGGTNPDVINFIQKQEEYIEQLERESQYCRDELNNLLGKVKEVISENEHLHEAQKNKLISRMFHTYNAGSETDELDDVGDSTGLDSDNKVSPSKTRRAKSRSTKLEGPNIVFESRISELEAQLTQAKINLKKVQDENNENKRKLANGLVDSTCLDGFKRQIDNLQRDKSTLESQISKLKLNLEQKDGDLDSRYKRGSDAVEQQLREERNNLEMEIRRLKDDLAKERNKVRELAGEGARRAIQERSAAEQRYNAHFDELQHDLAAQYDNVAKLQLELERQRREENDLKRELSMKSAAVEELKMELKNKSSSLQADLAQAHAEKASLEEELASARLAIERQQRQSKHEVNRLNSEIQSLRQRLDRADADLVHSRRENLRLSEQISTLEKELNMKSLTPISPEKNKKEKELSTMLESMENKHAKTVAELESMIHSQNSLMEKLSSECRLLTNKLDDANRRHKKELATLQRQVESLGKSLQSTYSHPPSNYEAPSSHATAAHRVSHSPTSARSDYTRTESSGDPKFRGNDNIHRDDLRDHNKLGNINQEHNVQHSNNDNTNYTTEVSNEQHSYESDMPQEQQNYVSDVTQDVENYNTETQQSPQNYNKELTQDLQNDDEHQEQQAPDLQETIQNIAYDDTTNEEPHTNVVLRKMSKQNSRESIDKEKSLRRQLSKDVISFEQEPVEVADPNPETENYDKTEQQEEGHGNAETKQDQEYMEQVEYHNETEKPFEEQTEQYDTQHYSDENYQNYEQPQYTEQYESYEQYPQQYDPNAQYDQYENYPTEGNYSEQTYDNIQNSQEYTTEHSVTAPEHPETAPEHPETAPEHPETAPEQSESNTNEEVASQS